MKQPLILGSSSPRRQFLLREIGFDFQVRKPDVDESFPGNLLPERVPLYLARKKAEALPPGGSVVVTADTVVILDSRILNKPGSRQEAVDMLSDLNGRAHRVVTGVCIRSAENEVLFSEESTVVFRTLRPADIELYVDKYQPYDKAGAYGAQDSLPAGFNPCSDEENHFLHSIGRESLMPGRKHLPGADIVLIERIHGSYFNVMGLPLVPVHHHLRPWA
ncbi:MAG: Maf family protein [Cyclobacteriaceae bacterium]|jgi:septum formation protein|nr:Maf family protein [Cyclobacteriaceae bacterium]